MIYAFHITWTTYGHWFPNDPRGSWSDQVWQPRLARVRELDDDRHVLRPRDVSEAQLREFLHTARTTLVHPVVALDESKFEVVAEAFAEIGNRWRITMLALAVLPHHVHLLIRRPACSYERLVSALKGRSSQRIRQHRGMSPTLRPADRVPIWTRGYWVRYVPDHRVAEGVAQYIEENPVKHGLPPQKWDFVEGL